MHFDDASLTGYLLQLSPFIFIFFLRFCNQLRAPAIKSSTTTKKNRGQQHGNSSTTPPSHSQIHERNQIESINNLFGDYFQSTIHTDQQHAHTRPYCSCEHPSLSVILKHFAFFVSPISFFYAGKQTDHSLYLKNGN